MSYKDKVIALLNSQELSKEQKEKLKSIFPELSESKDEQIRKTLMQNLKERFGTKGNMGEGLDMPDVLAWLEKQGEQNPAEKKTTWYDNMDDLIADAMIDDIKNADMPEHCKHNRLTWINKHRSKPAEWSDKDEAMITLLHNIIDHHYSMDIIKKEKQLELEDWLKSLKDRVQPQQEWNEEDEHYLLVCKNALAKYQTTDKWDAHIISHWLEDKLKSLRPQNRWKPTEEQIRVVNRLRHCFLSDVSGNDIVILDALLEQLKEL